MRISPLVALCVMIPASVFAWEPGMPPAPGSDYLGGGAVFAKIECEGINSFKGGHQTYRFTAVRVDHPDTEDGARTVFIGTMEDDGAVTFFGHVLKREGEWPFNTSEADIGEEMAFHQIRTIGMACQKMLTVIPH